MKSHKVDKSNVQVPEVKSWPEEGLEYVGGCPVCGTTDRRLMYEGLTDRVFFCAPGEWSLYRYENCASGYLDPRPTKETIHLAYQKYYTHDSTDENTPLSELGWIRSLRRTIANGYRNAQYGTDYQPASHIGSWLAYLVPAYRRVLDREMRHLPKPPSDGRLLDVGCGSGAFLKQAEEAGWKVEGVDPDPDAVKLAQDSGLDVRQGGIEMLKNEKEKFDVVTLSHVIEHTHNPREMIVSCYRLLKRGGLLWVETPNLDSMGHHKYGRSWRGIEAPRHLVIFTLKSITEMMKNIGFKKSKTKISLTSEIVVMFLKLAVKQKTEKIHTAKKPPRSNFCRVFICCSKI